MVKLNLFCTLLVACTSTINVLAVNTENVRNNHISDMVNTRSNRGEGEPFQLYVQPQPQLQPQPYQRPRRGHPLIKHRLKKKTTVKPKPVYLQRGMNFLTDIFAKDISDQIHAYTSIPADIKKSDVLKKELLTELRKGNRLPACTKLNQYILRGENDYSDSIFGKINLEAFKQKGPHGPRCGWVKYTWHEFWEKGMGERLFVRLFDKMVSNGELIVA
eukprot:Pgem_evm1s5883